MKKFILTILAAVLVTVANAQDVKITGQVTSASDNEPLIGVTVKVVGSSSGAITDFDGNYTITADKNATLEYTMIGFSKVQQQVNGRSVINVVLEDMVSDLDEVVVIGYGSVKKGDLTSSISAVKGEQAGKTFNG